MTTLTLEDVLTPQQNFGLAKRTIVDVEGNREIADLVWGWFIKGIRLLDLGHEKLQK